MISSDDRSPEHFSPKGGTSVAQRVTEVPNERRGCA